MSLFDGMAGLLNDVFGGPVMIIPRSGGSFNVQAVFRSEPIEVADADGGSVWIGAPTLKVPADIAPKLAREDRIRPGNGKTYIVLNRVPGESPAADGFVMFELEEQDH